MIKESTIENTNLPAGWQVLPFGDVCEISGGSQPPKPTFIYEPKEGYIRLVQVRDYRTDKFITYIPKERAKKFCSKTDIMIGRYGPPIFGIFRGIEGAYNVALMKAIPNKELLYEEYLYWFLKTDSLIKFVEKSSKRAAGQDGVRKEVLYTYPTPIPPLNHQKQIVSILDKAFAAIDRAKANAEQNLQNAKELFESYLQNVFENKGDDWEEKTLENVCESISAGGDKPKELSKFKTEKFTIPIYANGEKNKGLYGFTNVAKVLEPSITISGRGTIGYSEIRNEPFTPIVRLIVLIPKKEKIDIKLLKYIVSNINFINSGSSIPQLTVPMVKGYKITYPSIKEQKSIVQKLDALSVETKKLEAIYTQKIADLEEMKKSVLQKAFSGQLNTIN